MALMVDAGVFDEMMINVGYKCRRGWEYFFLSEYFETKKSLLLRNSVKGFEVA
jgi:hypothetical protein